MAWTGIIVQNSCYPPAPAQGRWGRPGRRGSEQQSTTHVAHCTALPQPPSHAAQWTCATRLPAAMAGRAHSMEWAREHESEPGGNTALEPGEHGSMGVSQAGTQHGSRAGTQHGSEHARPDCPCCMMDVRSAPGCSNGQACTAQEQGRHGQRGHAVCWRTRLCIEGHARSKSLWLVAGRYAVWGWPNELQGIHAPKQTVSVAAELLASQSHLITPSCHFVPEARTSWWRESSKGHILPRPGPAPKCANRCALVSRCPFSWYMGRQEHSNTHAHVLADTLHIHTCSHVHPVKSHAHAHTSARA